MATLPVRSGPMALVERQLEMLSPRDRKLLVGMLLFFTVVFVGGFWYILNSLLDDKASRVRDAKAAFAVVQELEREYEQAAAQFRAQEDRLREPKEKPVTAWVEELASKHGITEQLRAVNQQSSEIVGDVARTRYKVEIKRATQEPLYRFLHELETSPYPAMVEQATFKVTTVKKEKFMDLTLELVVLSMAEG